VLANNGGVEDQVEQKLSKWKNVPDAELTQLAGCVPRYAEERLKAAQKYADVALEGDK